MIAQGVHGSLQIDGIPQHDSHRHQIETAGPVALRLEATIADFAQPVKEHSPSHGVACLTLVEPGLDATAQFDAWQPVPNE